jgi:pyridoxamine 5'-phosphate oxidase
MTTTKKQIILANEHKVNELSEKTVYKNPFVQFDKWFNLVLKMKLAEPNAMVLATADKKAKPSVRVVLLKGISSKGITFYTNYNSRKGEELLQNPSAALLFYWTEFSRQVRIEGKIKKLSRKESEKYFSSRPIGSRIAAWASEQSDKIPDREFLEKRFDKFDQKFSGGKVPLPPNWGGYRLVPNYFEFWQGRENRLHDRICYKKGKRNWKIFRLAP